MSNANYLFSLYQAALNPETVNKATQELINVYENPKTIFDHICLINQCGHTIIIKKYVILKLSFLLKSHSSNLSVDEIYQIIEVIINMILNENDVNCCYLLCDTISIFLFKLKDKEVWNIIQNFVKNRIVFFAKDLLKDQYIKIGLYLWQSIFPLIPSLKSFENSEVLDLFFILMQESAISLSSDDIDMRFQALKLVSCLHDFFPDELNHESQFKIISYLFISLMKEMNDIIFVHPDPNEISLFLSVIGEYIRDPPNIIEIENLIPFFEYVIKVLLDNNIPLEIRFLIHPFLDNSINIIEYLNYDVNNNNLLQIISLSISLSLEICKLHRDDDSYEFPLPFFYSLSDTFFDESGTIFEIFMEHSTRIIQEINPNQDLNEQMSRRQVALFILMSIIEGTQEYAANKISEIVHFIIQVGNVNDEYVFAEACKVINELIEFLSNPLSNFIDQISEFFFHYINFPNTLQILDSLFYQCDKAPKNIESIFQNFINLISVSNFIQIEQILSCINSLLSKLSIDEQSLLQSIIPVLIELQSSYELRGPVLEFYGQIITLSPLTFKQELPKIVSFGIDSFSLNDFQIDCSVAHCFKSIAKVLPISFSCFLPDIVPPFIAILQFNSSSLEEYQLSEFSRAQKECMCALSTFVGYIPQCMINYAQSPILDFIVQPRGGLEKYLVEACESLAYSAEGFKIINIPLFQVIPLVVPSPLSTCLDKDHVFSILMMLSEIISVFGNLLVNSQDGLNILELLIDNLILILSSPPIGFLKTDNSKTIDQQIQTPLFFLISQLIDTLGGNFSRYTERVCSALSLYFNSNSILMKANCIMTASHICYSCKITDTLFNICLNTSIQMIIANQNLASREIIAKSLKYLILANKNQILPRIDIIFKFSNEVAKDQNYVGLWYTFCIYFHDMINNEWVINNANIISEILRIMPQPIDSEEVSLEAEFVVLMTKQKLNIFESKLINVASTLFASSDKQFNSTTIETRIFLFNILFSLDDSQLSSLIHGNEFYFGRIKNHMNTIHNIS